MSWIHPLVLAWLAALPAQPGLPLDPGVDPLAFDVPATEIVVLQRDPPLEKAWLELTHLASDLPPVLIRVDSGASPFIAVPDLPPGPTLLCTGARSFGVLCQEIYRGAGDQVGLPWVEAELEKGLEVRGRYVQDLEGVEGARVALVPAELTAFRPYTMPLRVEGSRVEREVTTGAEGRFTLPPIGPGEYFLETVLPSGRVHRGEPFTVFLPEAPVPEPEELFVDLGRIDVATGLDVEFRVLDLAGEPIRGAAVFATQGRTPDDVLSFEGASNAEGHAVLHGLDVDRPVRLGCEKEGFEPFVDDYDLLPVSVDCVLGAWGRAIGEVIGPDSLVPWGATVSVMPASGGRAAGHREPISVSVASNGAFMLDSLAGGEYELRAAAPGYRVEERSFTVDYGQVADLGPILLLFGRQVDGRVIDSVTGEGIAGVDIRSLTPPGAVVTFSDIDGEFRFAVSSREALVLELATFDYARRELTLEPDDLESGDELVVELVPAGWILIEAEDGEGRPCQGCRVVIWPGGEELWTDALGEALSGPLEAGTHRVSRPRVTHLGSTVVEHPRADVERVRVRPGRLTVVRLTAGGTPLRVRFEGEALDGVWTLLSRTPRRSETAYADDDGRYEVRRRAGESLELFLNTWVEELGREISVWQATLPATALTDQVTVRLSGSRVTGRVVGLEGPLAGARIRLVGITDAALRAVVYADSTGGFHIPHVRPGVYNLYVGPRAVKFLRVDERRSLDLGTFELFLD